MKKQTVWLVLLWVVCSFGLVSCAKDTPVGSDPYANWQVRNEHYIDSIARVARNAPAGEKWEIYKNYKLDLVESGGGNWIGKPNQYYEYDSVYVKVLEKGEGIIPLSTDTVYVCYQGFLINGERFDGNYTGELNLDVHEATAFEMTASSGDDGLVTGWMTALYHMNTGTKAEIYIPYKMGYKESGYQSIPGYSTLIFELYLDKVTHRRGPDDRSLKQK